MLCTRCHQRALNVSNVDHLVHIYPAHMYEGVKNCFCLSVSLSVCQSSVIPGLNDFQYYGGWSVPKCWTFFWKVICILLLIMGDNFYIQINCNTFGMWICIYNWRNTFGMTNSISKCAETHLEWQILYPNEETIGTTNSISKWRNIWHDKFYIQTSTGPVGWLAQASEGPTLESWVTHPLSVLHSVPTLHPWNEYQTPCKPCTKQDTWNEMW